MAKTDSTSKPAVPKHAKVSSITVSTVADQTHYPNSPSRDDGSKRWGFIKDRCGARAAVKVKKKPAKRPGLSIYSTSKLLKNHYKFHEDDKTLHQPHLLLHHIF